MKNLKIENYRLEIKVFRNVANLKNHNEVGKIIKEKKKFGF